jgi:hypothetical protein
MNNTLKSAIPVAVISAVLVALFFVGYSFWFKERVLTEIAQKQKNDIDNLQSAYQAEMEKLTERLLARVDETNKTLDEAIKAGNSDLFLTGDEARRVQTEKVEALADAVMTRLEKAIPTPEDQERGYNTVSQRVSDRLNPILTEIARTGNLTRSDVEFYSSQITGMIDGVLRDEMAEKQRLNNNLLTTASVAQDSMRLAQEMAALYLSSLKDEGVLSRILSLPVRVVQDASKMSIVGSSDRRKMEERLFGELDSLEKRLGTVQSQLPKAAPAADGSAPAAESSATPAPVRAAPTPPSK